MPYRNCFILCFLVAALASMGGCARAARDTAGFALEHTISVPLGQDDAWQVVKEVLLEQELDLYTRDKRGRFVAYSKMRRNFRILTPRRTKYTVELATINEEETSIYIETVKQVYGVTLLTYPDWHDRAIEDETGTVAIIEAIQAKVSGAPEGDAASGDESA